MEIIVFELEFATWILIAVVSAITIYGVLELYLVRRASMRPRLENVHGSGTDLPGASD